MLRGLYTAAAGMIAQQRKHDTVTNNIANVNTVGFKQGNVLTRSFPEMLINLINGGEGTRNVKIGRMNTGVLAEENISTYVQGDLQETRNPSDIAIVSKIQVPGVQFDAAGKAVTPEGETIFQPQAFFTVFGAGDQERYTRNGKFSINTEGNMVTSDGYRVMGSDGQPIVIDRPMGEIVISPSGQLSDAITGQPLVDGAGVPMALFISRIDNPNKLIREGNGNYRLEDEENPARVLDPEDQVQVAQGYFERSNVDAAQSTVDMMAALRAYEANQKVIQFYDRSLDKAVNEVGRV